MLSEQYKREMEQLGPRQEELERLYTLIEGGTDMKWKKWLGRRAVAAIAVCAALTLTATAAAVPAVWRSLQEHLGPFAPYAQYIKGASCTDQGIRIQVLSAVSDDLEARFYLSVRDVEGDRINEFLDLKGSLEAGEEWEPEPGETPPVVYGGGYSTRNFELVSYDPGTKTALLTAKIYYEDAARPNGEGKLTVTGMDTRHVTLYGDVSLASLTGKTLKSLPLGKEDKVIYKPSDLGGTGYTNAVLPSKQVVLAPDQTPMPLNGTKDIRVSSMGFASDGCFHIRLEFDEGVRPALRQDGTSALLFNPRLAGGTPVEYYVCQQALVEGGMDILFPLIKAGDLGALQGGQIRISGDYFRPGEEIEGAWSTQFQMEHYSSVTLDWTGELDGCLVRQVTVSPLSVTMRSNDKGGFANSTLYAVKKDGTTVASEPGLGAYNNLAAKGGEGWDAFNTWSFEEPVDVEDISFLSLKGTLIPVN